MRTAQAAENSLGRSTSEDTRLALEVLLGIGRTRVGPDVSPVVVRIDAWVGEDQLASKQACLSHFDVEAEVICRRTLIEGLSWTLKPTGRLIHSFCGGRFAAAAALPWTIWIWSLGPMPLWKRMREVPKTPADRITRPLGFRGTKPFGPIEVSLV